jgi:hypothetical protein
MRDLNDIILGKQTLGDLTTAALRYVVPPYQRAYMWSKKESTSLFNSISKGFQAGDYIFLNGITLSSATLDSNSSEKKIVDGQQRLLTLAIYLQAIIDILKESNYDSSKINLLENSLFDLINEKKHPRFKSHNIYADEILTKLLTGQFSEIDIKKIKYPANKFTDMYSLSRKMILKETVTQDKQYELGEFILKKVFFSVTTTTPENEVGIFKTMNTTGLPLSGFDKLRIELYELTPPGQRKEFNIKWSEFTKYIWELPDSEESTMTYIGRGVTDPNVSAVEILNSLVKMAKDDGVLEFIDEVLMPSVKALTFALNSKYPCGETSIALRNLNYLSRVTRYRAIRPIFVASRNLTHSDSDKIFEQLLKTVLVLSLSDSRPQYNEDIFKEWSEFIQSNNIDDAIDSMKKLSDNHSEKFRKNFPFLSLSYLGSDGVRFLLAIVEQNILAAIGSNNKVELSRVFPRGLYHIEHIAPKGYAKEKAWEHLGPDFNTDSFANITMLEGTRNTSVGSGSFESKLKEYSVSKSYITSLIANDGVGGGKNNGAVHASKKFSQHSAWNGQQMTIRNQELANILCEELGIKEGKIESPLNPIISDSYLTLPQGRPENAIKILKKAHSGMSSLAELKEAINITPDNSGKEDITDRNFNYTIDALEYLGLGYKVDEIFTLSDTGSEIYREDDSIDFGLLELCFTASLIRSGLKINLINKIKHENRSECQQEVFEAFSIIFPEVYTEKTLNHRVSCILTWAEYIRENINQLS